MITRDLMEWGFEKIVFWFSVFAGIGFLLVKVFVNPTYVWLLREDNVLEWSQFIAYFISSLLAMWIAIEFARVRKRQLSLSYLVVFFGLFFIAIEEISWGQRIFGLQASAFFKDNNMQGEINIHNLKWAQRYLSLYSYIVIGAYGGFVWFLLPRKMKKKYGATLGWFVAPPSLCLYFVPVFALYLVFLLNLVANRFGFAVWDFLKVGDDTFLTWKDQEAAEFLLALGFLLFIALNAKRVSRMKANRGTSAAKASSRLVG
jgi:hypothetical protein